MLPTRTLSTRDVPRGHVEQGREPVDGTPLGRLLICTQAVDQDDPALGFFHRWLEEFAKHCEMVHVVCLKEGEHHLPENVHVHSLGKEFHQGPSLVKRAWYIMRFFRYIWSLRREYDAVFVHMNPEYVALGGILWRLSGKRIGLWYVHRSVNPWLRIAVLFAKVIFTATKESMRVRTSKLKVVGHGIDTVFFSPRVGSVLEKLQLVSVGRLAPIKNCDVLIEAAATLRKGGVPVEVTFVGAPTSDAERMYTGKLHAQVAALGLSGAVHFAGASGYGELPDVYRRATATVNLAPTGGSDKVVLESLACGVPVFVSNKAFAPLFGEYAERFMFRERDAADLADKLGRFLKERDTSDIAPLTEKVRREYPLPVRIAKIAATLLRLV